MTMTKTPLPIPEEEDQSGIDLGPLRQEEGVGDVLPELLSSSSGEGKWWWP